MREFIWPRIVGNQMAHVAYLCQKYPGSKDKFFEIEIFVNGEPKSGLNSCFSCRCFSKFVNFRSPIPESMSFLEIPFTKSRSFI